MCADHSGRRSTTTASDRPRASRDVYPSSGADVTGKGVDGRADLIGFDDTSILDSLPFYVLLIDEDHRILFANKAVQAHLGLNPQQIVGEYCPKVVHGLDGPFPDCPLGEAVRHGRAAEREIIDPVSGSWLHSAVYPTGQRTPDGRAIFLHLGRDITDKKTAEEELSRSYRNQKALDELLRISLSDLGLEQMLDLALRQLFSIPWLGIESRGAIFLVEDNPEVLVLKAQCSLPASLQVACAEVPFGECLCGRAALSGRAEFSDCIDERHDHRWEGISPHGHFCVPLLSEGKTIGVLALYLPAGQPHDGQDESFLRAAADIIAGIVGRHRLEEALRRANQGLESRVKRRTEELAKANSELRAEIAERTRTEAALRESEEAYSLLVGNLADAVFRYSEGAITWCNDKIGEMLGYTKDELVGTDVNLFLSDDTSFSEVYDSANTGLKKEGSFHGITGTKRKDGSVAYIEYSASLVPGKDPIEIVGVARDITQRKLVEEALARSESRYRLLAENVTDVITCMDMNMKPTYVSPSIERLLGFTVEEALNRSMEEALTPASQQIVTEAFAEELAIEARGAGTPARTRMRELECYRKDGSTVWVETTMSFLRGSDGQILETVNVLRDITDRKKAEEELLVKHNAMEKSITAMAISDIQGTVTYLNEACLRLWKIETKQDVIGQSFWALLRVEDTAIVDEIARTMIETGSWQGELRCRTQNGESIDVHVLSAMICDQQDKPIHTITSFIDITERKSMEQQLLLSGRLASVGELAAGVAHELNNPLAAVLGYAQLLSDRDDLDETTKADVDTICTQAQRAARITANLLSFARKHDPEKVMISVNDAVEKSLELHAYRLKVNNIEVALDLDPDLPTTMADFNQIQQVFVNLITNAEQAMTEARGKGRLLIKTHKVGEMLQIAFTDDGPGIPEELLKSVFDPFFTTKEVGEGTGLGLSICYGIVRGHGGQISVDSKPGQGATFAIELPIVSEGNTEQQAVSS